MASTLLVAVVTSSVVMELKLDVAVLVAVVALSIEMELELDAVVEVCLVFSEVLLAEFSFVVDEGSSMTD